MTEAQAIDIAQRRLGERGLGVEIDDIQVQIATAVNRVGRASIFSTNRSGLEVAENVTLSSPDTYGLQSGTFTTLFPESVDNVTHPDKTLAFVRKKDIQDCLILKSNSSIGQYTIKDNKIYCKAAATLATGSQAILHGVKIPALISDLPTQMHPLVVDQLVELVLEALGQARLDEQGAGVIGAATGGN